MVEMSLLFIPILILGAGIIYLTHQASEIKKEEPVIDEEELWFDWEETFSCELCDEIIYEGEALVYIRCEGELVPFCEYCLNPLL
jgi:hypothetical protein